MSDEPPDAELTRFVFETAVEVSLTMQCLAYVSFTLNMIYTKIRIHVLNNLGLREIF